MTKALKMYDLERSVLSSMSSPQEDPYRRINLSPKEWGPPGWSFINSIIHGYPLKADYEEQQRLLQFIYSLSTLLPCAKCRSNYANFIKRRPPNEYVQGRDRIAYWFKLYKAQNK